MPRERRRQGSNYFKIIFLALLFLTGAYFIQLIFRQSKGLFYKPNNACNEFFHNQTYTRQAKPVNTILIGEIHGGYEQHVANCLASLAKPGDHLLLEVPKKNNQEIPCDTLHPAYLQFNGKLKCFAFDLPIDENHRLYADNAFRADFISNKLPILFRNSAYGNDVIQRIKSFAEELSRASSTIADTDPERSGSVKRHAKYLSRLANKLHGLDLTEMKEFLLKEKERVTQKAHSYELLSRRGPTNEALVNEIKRHQPVQNNQRYTLFAVAGARHLELSLNTPLEKFIETEPTTILMPKR